MVDLTLRELARRAMSSGSREDYLTYFNYLIRIGGNPLERYKELAEMFGHVEDIDSYLQEVARSEEAMEEFLGPLRVNAEQFELPTYFKYDLAKTIIQDEIDLARSRIGRRWGKSHWSYPNYTVKKVLRVYSTYYQEEMYNALDGSSHVENWQRGIIADVILNSGATTTIWIENWFAVPDAPDSVAFGVTVRRFDQPTKLRPHAWQLMRTIEATAPKFAKAALLPRLQALHDAGPYRD